MAESVLVVVDMQNDFVNGALGTKEAEAIVPDVSELVGYFKGTVVFTQDTHDENYLNTQEGKHLPVPHCIKGTDGWQLVPSLVKWQEEHQSQVFEKPQFGSKALAEAMAQLHATKGISDITLVGICTDICVLSNAILLKAFLSEVPIKVVANCCAGVTPAQHEAALTAMKSCQIEIV